jgi:isoamylase
MSDQQVYASNAYPLGPTITSEGTNFSVFSASAKRMEIVLFDHADALQPSRVIALDPVFDRTAHYWHIFVPGITSGQLYGYRADGPDDPSSGQRFDRQKVLLDPYGKSVSVGRHYDRAAACKPGDNAATSMKSVLVDLNTFDWEGDTPLNRPFGSSVIYELHVAGFTRHPNSGVADGRRGTYLGVIDKIPYLKELGITAVELLPVYQFDAGSSPTGVNYWGYDPISFFAPHLAYSASGNPLTCLDEFRTMVKQLHRAGIEVILDVVYNHTAEGDEHGPTLSFRGLENSLYYILNEDRATYANYTGAGNTLKANNSVVKRLILDSLRYWVSKMHVDGFRFDLASVLSRSESGEPMMDPPIILQIDSDPVLASAKLIAEAWDAAGLYQVGSFGQDKWKEWNGRFRDDIRSFIKGDQNTVEKLRERLTGSFDLYKDGDRPASQSINFVTCHDGFTLNDLVSFDHKHNQANHELNADGSNTNLSWNCGVEGMADPPEVELLRIRQIKNFLALNLLSVGTPMLLMGDEVRRTQQGNNNAYCQDNEMSWLDWSLCDLHKDILRFVRELIRLRLKFDERTTGDWITLAEFISRARIEWHGVELGKPDWGRESHSIALTTHNFTVSRFGYMAVNSYWQPLEFELPPVAGGENATWLRFIDTSLPSPEDIVEESMKKPVNGSKYLVNPRSIVMLHYQ